MHQNKSLPGEEPCLLWGDFSVLKNESCFVLFLVILWLEFHCGSGSGSSTHTQPLGSRWDFLFLVICVTKSKRISPNEATVNIYKGSLLRK